MPECPEKQIALDTICADNLRVIVRDYIEGNNEIGGLRIAKMAPNDDTSDMMECYSKIKELVRVHFNKPEMTDNEEVKGLSQLIDMNGDFKYEPVLISSREELLIDGRPLYTRNNDIFEVFVWPGRIKKNNQR